MRRLNSLSIVVPCHNEEEVVRDTHRTLTEIAQSLIKGKKIKDYEILYINNGSSDRSQEILEDLFKVDNHARVLELRRNFGFQGSLSAG